MTGTEAQLQLGRIRAIIAGDFSDQRRVEMIEAILNQR